MTTEKSTAVLNHIFNKDKYTRFIKACIGLLIMAASYNVFFVPNGVVYGGMSGLGIILNYLFGIKTSIVVLIGSAILLILSFIMLGKSRTMGSVAGSLLFPLFIEITAPLAKVIDLGNVELLLIIIIGSIISGFGSGIIFKAGYSSGGTDIANQIICQYAKVPISTAMLFTDGLIIIAHLFIFGLFKFIYSVVAIIIFGIVADKVIIGISKAKQFNIVTSKPDDVKEYIITHLNKGVTMLNVVGGYTSEAKKMLMCVIPTKDYYRVKEGILTIDPEAFFIVTDAYEVYNKEKGGS